MSDIGDILRLPDRELWLVTSGSIDAPAGMIATFVSNASIVADLPRIIVGIARQHHTWSAVQDTAALALHLLDESQIELVWRFGLQSGHTADKFAGLSLEATVAGIPRISGCVAWLGCRVETSMDTGDRTIFLAEILDGKLERSAPLLTLKRLLELAPPERLRELREGMARDAAIDAAAIQKWRQRQA